MQKLVLVFYFSIWLLSCGRPASNQQPSGSVTSNQVNNASPDRIGSEVVDTSDLMPTFDRALLTGIWWRADQHEPSATFTIKDSLFNFVDQDPESYYKFAIHYDTLVVLKSTYNAVSIIKKLTRDSLILDWGDGKIEMYIHTEPQ